ncbi:MAG: TIGR03936 family radical SAM-associated protein [Anaerolineales bacterium]
MASCSTNTMRIRITFSKQGALRYTGHLDLHKLWERAARRAELPLAYSQGFHPQPKMSLASALPLGFSSTCEVLDMRLERDVELGDLRERLNETLRRESACRKSSKPTSARPPCRRK